MDILNQLLNSIDDNAENIAFCIKGQDYSYVDLKKRICFITSLIEEKRSFIVGDKIGIMCYDSIDTYAAIFAIWFSGYGYIPLGWDAPNDRKVAILEESQANTYISDVQALQIDGGNYLGINIYYQESEFEDYIPLTIKNADQDRNAYTLFTSGSTGTPKGVPITFTNLSAFVKAFYETGFYTSSNDKCLQMFELTFDVSISSFLPPLLNGSTIYTIPNDEIKYLQVIKLIQKYNISSIQIVPSVIKLSLKLLPKITLPSVSKCILTGEASSIDLIPIWKKALPNAEIFNYYGPTEATIFCSFLKVGDKIKSYNDMIAIGKPFNGMNLIVVDQNGNKLPSGEKGELLISGPQITKGYINSLEKNITSFVSREHNGAETVFYKSGDLCYFDQDEDIYYCGRLDNQIKIQGYRVELSEIELTVKKLFAIPNVVVPLTNKLGITELVLVLENLLISLDEIKEALKKSLPGYMIPSRVLNIDVFPLTSSGKVDRVTIGAEAKKICYGS